MSILRNSATTYDPKSKQIATEYIALLRNLLKEFDVKIIHRGSTAYGIAGKGDIEIGIFPSEEDWDSVVSKLKEGFGELGNGEAAKIDIALTNYLRQHPEVLKRYEEIKKKHSSSKREYQIQKDRFLRSVIDSIPE